MGSRTRTNGTGGVLDPLLSHPGPEVTGNFSSDVVLPCFFKDPDARRDDRRGLFRVTAVYPPGNTEGFGQIPGITTGISQRPNRLNECFHYPCPSPFRLVFPARHLAATSPPLRALSFERRGNKN